MSLAPLLYARGDTRPIEVTLKDGAGAALLPTGKVIRVTAKRSAADADAAAVLSKSTADGSVVHQGGGVYHVLPTAAETSGLTDTTVLVYDVEVQTVATGARETANLGTAAAPIYTGLLLIVPDVTRGS